MFCDNCGDEIGNAAPAFTLPNGDIVCEGCWEDHQDEYTADDEAESEGE